MRSGPAEQVRIGYMSHVASPHIQVLFTTAVPCRGRGPRRSPQPRRMVGHDDQKHAKTSVDDRHSAIWGPRADGHRSALKGATSWREGAGEKRSAVLTPKYVSDPNFLDRLRPVQ